MAFACWDRRFATERSCTTIWPAHRSYRWAGPMSRTAAATGSKPREDKARFGYAVGPHSWKRFLFPPELRLWRARRAADGDLLVEEEPTRAQPMAFIGVRSCELHAIDIQDRVFMGGRHADRDYAARRGGAFLVAVNCITAGGTCFCASMDTGPKADGRLRPCADRAARRRAPIPGRGRNRARRRAARGAAATAGDRRRSRRRRRCGRGDRRGDGPHASRSTTSAICWPATSSTRAGMTSPPAA